MTYECLTCVLHYDYVSAYPCLCDLPIPYVLTDLAILALEQYDATEKDNDIEKRDTEKSEA